MTGNWILYADPMKSRLELVLDWKILARQARYRPMRLAKLCQASLRQLQRFILIKFHVTLRAWLDQLRLHRAIELLVEGLPIKDVAGEIGLKQPTYFFRFFKRARRRMRW